MRTQVTISAYTIQVSIAGISIEINRDELFESIDTLQNFVKNIWPEDHKEDLETMGFFKACELINKYKPLAVRALACYTFEETASSIIIINEDGTIEMKSCEQNAKLDVKALMQVVSEFSKLVEEEKEARAEKRKAENEASRTIIQFPMGETFEVLKDMLFEADVYEEQVCDYVRKQSPNARVTKIDISNMNSLWERAEYYKARIEITFNPEDESTDQGMIDNEIEFNSRPTNGQVLEAIAIRLGSATLNWEQFYTKMVEEFGTHLHKQSDASTSTCINACDIYGFKAICHFNLG